VLRALEAVEMLEGHVVRNFDRRKGWVDLRDLSGKPDPIWLRSGATRSIERIGDLLYVQLNEVGNEEGETFAQFAERVRREIAAAKPAKVALDLRRNQGGNGMLVPALVRALIQSEEIDRKGRLFAIIGSGTWSAAQMLADALEKYTNVTFVGEPTASKGNAYSDSRLIVLPRSGITVGASIYYWQDWHPEDPRDATMPEIEAPLTVEAYRDNVDPAIEAILRVKPSETRR
jgi:C-terminal processing protease CtpA/Prc